MHGERTSIGSVIITGYWTADIRTPHRTCDPISGYLTSNAGALIRVRVQIAFLVLLNHYRALRSAKGGEAVLTMVGLSCAVYVTALFVVANDSNEGTRITSSRFPPIPHRLVDKTLHLGPLNAATRLI